MASQLRPDSDPAPFTHPGDLIDQAHQPPAPFAEQLVSVTDKREVAEIFVRLFAGCIPFGGPHKCARRWRGGYHRMVAIAYVVAPELFGGLSPEQVSLQLGISQSIFRRFRRDVETQLEMRAFAARERRARGR